MSTLMKEKGFDYAFKHSACEKGIEKLLEIDVKAFVQKYLFKKMYKYSIKEKKNNG